MRILSNCSIGIYPRNVDLKRSMSKIFSYIGADLPIVTYDLYDTEVVKFNNLGYSVNSVDEFVDKIIFLKNNPDKLQKLSSNVSAFKNEYTWKNLSKKMEDYLVNF
jgi:glycosyltransferase involved in cell wall biosynthesis